MHSHRGPTAASHVARSACAILLLLVLVATGCRRGATEWEGWRALDKGMTLSTETGTGPNGEDATALLYTMATGEDYAIERDAAGLPLNDPVELRLWCKATRALHLAVVLVDTQGQEHECARTYVPDEWRELTFDRFEPPVASWESVRTLRLVDLTAVLGGQGPVSLKIVGLPH